MTLSTFLTIIITIIVIPIGLYIVDTICSTKSPCCFSKTAHLSWGMLKKLYSINHDRWRYESVILNGYVTLRGWNKVILYNTAEDVDNMWMRSGYYHCNSDGYNYSDYIVRVKLSFFGWLQFHFNRIFNKKKDIVGTEMLLDSVSRDIDRVHQKAQKQIEEASKIIQDVAKRMEGL